MAASAAPERHEPTAPEELHRQTSAYVPKKIRTRLRFACWLLGIETGLAIAHLLVPVLGDRPMQWSILIVLLAGIIQSANSIRNGRRILRRQHA